MPIIIDITEAGLVGHWRPYRKDEDVQRVYEGTLSAGYDNISPSCFQPNFQRREIQHLWNLEVIELRLLILWKGRSRGNIWAGQEEEVEPGMDGWTRTIRHKPRAPRCRTSYRGRLLPKDLVFHECTIEAKEHLMRGAAYADRSRVMIEEALADRGRAQTAPARLTKRSKREAKLDAIKVKDGANRKANRKLSFEARARKLVEDGDAPSLSTAKNWLRDLDSRQH
jgi:hypothetical protein